MKVYELMSALENLPSGAEIYCSGTLSINDLKEGSLVYSNVKESDALYNVIKHLETVTVKDERRLYLNF